MRKFLTCLILSFALLLLVLPAREVSAQDPTPSPSGPVYVVQKGDTLFSIAYRFGLTVDDLMRVNTFVNPDILSTGTEIVIPGLDGVSGKLVTETIPLGENLRSLSIRYQIRPDQITHLNHLTGPTEVFAGASLVIPDPGDASQPQIDTLLQPGQSLFELAVANQQNPWALADINLLSSTNDLLPGEAVFSPPGSTPAQSISLASPYLQDIQIDPLPLVQGFTSVVKVTAGQPIELSGTLAGNDLKFFPNGENQWVALQGIDAMADPGIYPITLQGKLPDGKVFSFEQMVILQAAGYTTENINGVDPATTDPANTVPENEKLATLITPATATRYWDDLFTSPGYDPNWITSWFGTRRAYNGSSNYSAYHTGIDYGGGPGLEIKADAPGVVVFTGPLIVRGNATVIDHGWGVYSAFYHQSEFKVKVGDQVSAGQVIGIYGGTGRVTGPHLHWEIWVNGVVVNPLTWLERTYP